MRILSILLFVLLPFINVAQDSIKQLLDQAYQLEQINPDSAILLYHQATNLSQHHQDFENVGRSLQYLGIVYANQSNADSAYFYYNNSIDYFKKSGYKKGIAATHTNLGNLALVQNDYDQAIHYYLQAITTFKDINEKLNEGITHTNISGIFNDMALPQKAMYHSQEALDIGRQLGDTLLIIQALSNLGKTYLFLNDTISSITYLKNAETLATQIQGHYFLSTIYSNLIDIYKNSDSQEALKYAQKTLFFAQKSKHQLSIIGAHAAIADIQKELDQFSEALQNYQLALSQLNNITSPNLKGNIYHGLSEVYEKLNRPNEALKYYKQYSVFQDSVYNFKINKQVTELETRYQTAQKDKEILEQRLLIQQQTKEQNMLIGITILLSLLGFGIYLFYQQRLQSTQLIAQKTAELQEQKIIELEKTQKILALDAMISGQEEERKRIAQDLHDGLGGLLATVKLQFGIIQKEMNKLSEMNVYQKANDMLDDACTEVRRIAHNMMPDALLKLGLVEAIKDMTKGIEQPRVEVLDLGMGKLSETQQIMLYRIIQEIIKNTIKHANATQLIIQFFQEKNQVSILLEDDGKGFLVEPVKERNGLGLNSIDSRVKYLNGAWEIDSELGVGTTTTINIPLNAKK